MSIILRPVRKADIGDVMQLLYALGYEENEKDLLQVIEAIRHRGGEAFVAVRGTKVIGCTCAIIDVRLAEGIAGEITSVIVSREYRGQGIGKRLVACAEQWLQPLVPKIRVRANVTRQDSRGFYTALGFEVVKEQKVFVKKVEA